MNNGETWFFGHNILHCYGSAIQNQFLYNFACWSIKKEPELYPIYVYQLGYSVLHNSRNNNVGQSQKWAWLEESRRLVSKSSAKLPVGYTQHGELMMDAMLLVICLGSSAGVGRITNTFHHEDFTPVTCNCGGLFATSIAWFEVIFILGKIRRKMEELQDANMELCGFNKQLKFSKLEIPELLEEKMGAKRVWIESISKGSLEGERKIKKASSGSRSK